MAIPQDPAFWETLLAQLLEPDTKVINEATAKLTKLLETPESTIYIFERLSNSGNLGVRHHAALLVRRRLKNTWENLQQNVRDGMKDTLANIILHQETPRPIRKASADIISVISKILIPAGTWPTYLPFVVSLIKSDTRADLRETGLYLLQQIMEFALDTDSDLVSNNFKDITELIGKGLQDSSIDVRVQSMACMNTFVECLTLDNEVEIFLALLPPLISAIKVCVDDHEERVAIGFEVLNYIAESHIGQIKNLLPDLLVFMLTIGTNLDIPITIRQKALMFLEFVISTKPKTFVNSNLLETTIQVAFQLMTEPEDDISGEDTGSKYGAQLVDTMCLVMPPNLIWPHLMSKVSQFTKHSDPEYRKAAINAIAILAEGCMEEVEEIFDELMPCVLNGFNQENVVRQASCIAIAELAKNLPDFIIPYGEQLVPIMIQGIQDSQDLVRVKSCYAIQECSTSLKEYFMPHIEPLLKRLVEMLTDSNIEVQELAVGALSAIVEMAEESIAPYFTPIIDVMKKWMVITDKKQISIRARATECVATLATVQKELFLPHFAECIQIVLNGFQLDSAELRVFIYGYCEHMARLFTEQLTPYVDTLVPCVFASIESMDGFADLPEDDFTVDVSQDLDLQKLGQVVDEKDAAISLLGWLAFNYCTIFQKYIERATEDLMTMVNFMMSPSTSSCATLALVQLCSCVQTLLDPDQSWVVGVVEPLNPAVSAMINEVMERMLENLENTEDIIVRNTLDAIGNLAIAFGPAAIQQDAMVEIVNAMISLLKREAPCQLVRESFDEGDSEFAVFACTMEAVSQFARVYGNTFVAALEQFLMCLPPYLEPNSPTNFKNCIIATLAEVVQELKDSFSPYCATFLPICMDLLVKISDKSMKHNACYCAGLLVQYGGASVHQFFEKLCAVLSQTMTLDPIKYETVLDNACGSLARMINVAPNLVPVDQVIPAILGLLPLRSDYEPAIAIHESIFNLFKVNHSSVVNSAGQITTIFVQELLTNSLPSTPDNDLRNQLVGFLKGVYGANKASIDAAMGNMVQQGIASQETASALHSELNA